VYRRKGQLVHSTNSDDGDAVSGKSLARPINLVPIMHVSYEVLGKVFTAADVLIVFLGPTNGVWKQKTKDSKIT